MPARFWMVRVLYPHVHGWGAKALERVQDGVLDPAPVGQPILHERCFTRWP
jgi:hypothetical protein